MLINKNIKYLSNEESKFLSEILIYECLNNKGSIDYNVTLNTNGQYTYNFIMIVSREYLIKVLSNYFKDELVGNKLQFEMSENSYDTLYNCFVEKGFKFLLPSKQSLYEIYLKEN